MRLPISTWSQAALIAPQLVWPSTTSSRLPASLHENSMLPRMSVLMMFPAMRIEKMSPRPWSKISSAEVRLSMHERTVAKGH